MSLIFRCVAQCAAVGSNQGHSSYAARGSTAACEERAPPQFFCGARSWREREAGEESVMLKIAIHNEGQAPSFVVEGKLVGPWVKELEKCWESVLATEPPWAMVVNLTEVTFIDSEGRELLTRMRRQGARLVSAGCLMNAIVAEIEAEVKKEEQSMTRSIRRTCSTRRGGESCGCAHSWTRLSIPPTPRVDVSCE